MASDSRPRASCATVPPPIRGDVRPRLNTGSKESDGGYGTCESSGAQPAILAHTYEKALNQGLSWQVGFMDGGCAAAGDGPVHISLIRCHRPDYLPPLFLARRCPLSSAAKVNVETPRWGVSNHANRRLKPISTTSNTALRSTHHAPLSTPHAPPPSLLE